MSFCKYCSMDLGLISVPSQRKNHVRWCPKKPPNTGFKNHFDKAKSLGIAIVPWNKGKPGRRGWHHTEERKRLLSEKARKSKHRRLRKGVSFYRGIMMDSSWEVELAKRLDSLGVVWTRPEPIEWIDSEEKTHNYFPDFYLPDYDLYLDPKNPHAYNVQRKKIEILQSTVKNLFFLTSLDDIKNYDPRSE